MSLIQTNWTEDKPYCIYKRTSPKGHVYIGQIRHKNLQKRFHLNGEGYIECPYFYNAIQKYGWDNFIHEIIVEGLIKMGANKYERQLISEYKKLSISYNISNGGDGSIGTTFNQGRVIINNGTQIKRIPSHLFK